VSGGDVAKEKILFVSWCNDRLPEFYGKEIISKKRLHFLNFQTSIIFKPQLLTLSK
jgi:hypothetical protein